MTLRAWRIVKAKFADEAFRGEGARRYGGRWNTPGRRIVYVAGSRSLAALEVLVHLESSGAAQRYVFCEVSFEESLILRIQRTELPKNWSASPAPVGSRTIGDRWAAERRSAVLEVPRAIIPEESNYLLNPEHEDFGRIHIGNPEPFHFDSRLGR